MIAKGAHPAVVVPIVSQKTGEELICQFGYSGQKQTPQVAVCFEIIAGPNSGDRITWIGYFTETVQKNGKTVSERTLESLRVCGFKGDDLDKFNDQRPDQEVQLIVDHETGQDGKTYAKVSWVNDPNRAGGFVMENQMDPKQKRMFAAQFKAKLKSIPSVEGKKAERQPRSVAPTGDNGWSGNDQPDPPKPGEFDQSPPAGADDDQIPF